MMDDEERLKRKLEYYEYQLCYQWQPNNIMLEREWIELWEDRKVECIARYMRGEKI